MKVKSAATCNARINIRTYMPHGFRAFLKQCDWWLEGKFVVLMCTSFIRDVLSGNCVPIWQFWVCLIIQSFRKGQMLLLWRVSFFTLESAWNLFLIQPVITYAGNCNSICNTGVGAQIVGSCPPWTHTSAFIHCKTAIYLRRLKGTHSDEWFIWRNSKGMDYLEIVELDKCKLHCHNIMLLHLILCEFFSLLLWRTSSISSPVSNRDRRMLGYIENYQLQH